MLESCFRNGWLRLNLRVFIRKKKNKAGSTSVHIVQKVNGKQVHIKSVGHSNDAAELKRLEAEGYRQIADFKQQAMLPFGYYEDEQYIKQLKQAIQSVQPSICIQILGQLFNEVGFNVIKDAIFKRLVIMRLLYPVSKLRTVEYLYRHYQEQYDIDYVYRYMDKLHKSYAGQLQQISFDHAKSILGESLSIVFYDVTTLYFEAEHEDDLRKMGFSKDGKAQNPQIVLGLLVSKGGYPLAYEMFEGNKFEGKTMLPVIEGFKQRYQLGSLVVVADAGLLSNDNISSLVQAGHTFILGGRLKNESEAIKAQVLSLNLNDGQSAIIEKPGNLKLIVSYASARAIKDAHNRSRGLQKLEIQLKTGKLTKDHINNRGYNKYLKLEGAMAVSIDYDKYKQDARWDGLKSYITNTGLSKEIVIDYYKSLWHIEKAFRISKTDLKIRPVYHRLERRIKSHLAIAFCSYKIYKELERQLAIKKLSLSAEKALDIMKSIYSITTILPASKQETSFIIAKTDQQKDLLTAFNINF